MVTLNFNDFAFTKKKKINETNVIVKEKNWTACAIFKVKIGRSDWNERIQWEYILVCLWRLPARRIHDVDIGDEGKLLVSVTRPLVLYDASFARANTHIHTSKHIEIYSVPFHCYRIFCSFVRLPVHSFVCLLVLFVRLFYFYIRMASHCYFFVRFVYFVSVVSIPFTASFVFFFFVVVCIVFVLQLSSSALLLLLVVCVCARQFDSSPLYNFFFSTFFSCFIALFTTLEHFIRYL